MNGFIHRDREGVDVFARGVFAFVKGGVFVQRAARDGAFDSGRPLRPSAKKSLGRWGLYFG